MADSIEFHVKSEFFATMFKIGLGQLGALELDPVFLHDGKPSRVYAIRAEVAPAVVVGSTDGVDSANVIELPPDNDQNKGAPKAQFETVPNAVLPYFVQQLAVDIVRNEDLEASGTTAPPTVTTTASATYALFAITGKGFSPQLRFVFVAADLGPVLGAAPNADVLQSNFENHLRAHPITKAASLSDFVSQPMAKVFGELEDGANCRSTMAGDVIAVRLEIAEPDAYTLNQFGAFMQGTLSPMLFGRDWALLVPQKPIVAGLVSMLEGLVKTLTGSGYLTDGWVERSISTLNSTSPRASSCSRPTRG